VEPDRELIERVRVVPFAERVRRINDPEEPAPNFTEAQKDMLRAYLLEKYGKDGLITIGTGELRA